MKKTFHLTIALLALVLVFASCGGGNKNDEAPPTGPPSVFVAGYNHNDAVIWRNGKAALLPHDGDRAEAVSVFVADNGVEYAAGYEAYDYEDGTYNATPLLWRNGVSQTLNLTLVGYDEAYQTGYGEAHSVFVSGNNVYVAGEEWGYQWIWGYWFDVPRVWINGQVSPLENMDYDGTAQSVYVRNNVVYAAGYLWDNYRYYPALWKNGKLEFLTPLSGASESYARIVCVSESGNVFVAGNSLIDGVVVATLWENGAPRRLSYAAAPGSSATSVFVYGSDVYVSGQENYQENYVATMWKGGLNRDYTADYWTTGNAALISVYVYNGLVYAAGVDNARPAYQWRPACWIDKEPQTLNSAENGYAISIFVSGVSSPSTPVTGAGLNKTTPTFRQ